VMKNTMGRLEDILDREGIMQHNVTIRVDEPGEGEIWKVRATGIENLNKVARKIRPAFTKHSQFCVVGGRKHSKVYKGVREVIQEAY